MITIDILYTLLGKLSLLKDTRSISEVSNFIKSYEPFTGTIDEWTEGKEVHAYPDKEPELDRNLIVFYRGNDSIHRSEAQFADDTFYHMHHVRLDEKYVIGWYYNDI